MEKSALQQEFCSLCRNTSDQTACCQHKILYILYICMFLCSAGSEDKSRAGTINLNLNAVWRICNLMRDLCTATPP